MPNRYIRESAIESEAVNSLSWHSEVFYRRLLNRVDDFGRFTANPALLRASIFPLQLDKVRQAEIPRLLLECEQAGLLFVYTADSKATLIINRWEKGRAKESKYPPPPADICKRMQTYVYDGKHTSANVPDSDSDTDTDSDTDSVVVGGASRASAQSDAEWLASLKAKPVYAGINIENELQKAQTWCEANRRKCSRRFFTNWLNRAEQSIAPNSTKVGTYTPNEGDF